MSSTIQTISLVPVPIPAAIPVITPPQLMTPVVNSADYSTSLKTLSMSVTLEIPKNIDPNSIVVDQYIDPTNLDQLQFFFVYTNNGNNSFVPYTYTFDALSVDCTGKPIILSQISTVYSLMRGGGPKSSRGTVTSVRSIGGGIGDSIGVGAVHKK